MNKKEVKNGNGTEKKEIAVLTVAAVETVTPIEEQKEVITETPEELKRQVEELTKKLNEQPQSVEERIEFYKQKQEHIVKRDRLTKQLANFDKHRAILEEAAEQNDFENENYSIVLKGKESGFRESDLVTVNNPVLISELLTFIMSKLEIKINALDAKIAG